MCNLSLQQRKGLPLQSSSIYWVLMRSEEYEDTGGKIIVWFLNYCSVFAHTTLGFMGPQTITKQSQCQQKTRGTYKTPWLHCLLAWPIFSSRGYFVHCPPHSKNISHARLFLPTHHFLRLFLFIVVRSDSLHFKGSVGWKAGMAVCGVSLSSKRWYLCERRIREFTLLPAEENNNDCGHNQFYTAMARCALIWAGGWILGMATKHTHMRTRPKDLYYMQEY